MLAAFRTLDRMARERAATHGDRGYRFLGDGLAVTDAVTYAELDRGARRIAVAMQRRGVGKGDRALLLYPPGLDFVRAFWACMYAGVIAVPVPSPVRARLERTVARLRAVVGDADADVILTSRNLALRMPELRTTVPELGAKTWLATDEQEDDPSAWRDPDASPDDVALLQYTSGSTSGPRGVVVTHQNLLHNLDMLRAFHAGAGDMVMVHWLPLYHDMGLIRGMMSPLSVGGDCVMMAPMDFAQRPARWLRAIGAHRATLTGAPNFGYELCARSVPEGDLEGLDLSSLRLAFSSAEPNPKEHPRPLRRALRALRVPRGDVSPVVRARRSDRDGVRRDGIGRGDARGERRRAPAGAARARRRRTRVRARLVRPAAGRAERSRSSTTKGARARPARSARSGIRGPSVARGYWRRDEETARVFGARLNGEGPFLRTGDLGAFGPDGGLVVTGRKRGRDYRARAELAAHDIEETVEACSPRLRPGGTAAFGVARGGPSASSWRASSATP